MIESQHIYGDSSRLFLNTELGCTSACTYCYLPSEGFPIGLSRTQAASRISTDTLITSLIKDVRFRSGQSGTLLSIGCFSEAWDPRNRQDTLFLIKKLLELGNSIQLSTKRKVGIVDLKEIVSSRYWRGQLSLYISSATISHWDEHEPRTVAPAIRFQSFASCGEVGVSACLYIKPLIPKVTIKDWSLYGVVMSDYQIPAIVGERFVTELFEDVSPISKTLFVIHDDEVQTMRQKLAAFGPVFVKSEDALNYLRKKE